jgi:hypothetical protein
MAPGFVTECSPFDVQVLALDARGQVVSGFDEILSVFSMSNTLTLNTLVMRNGVASGSLRIGLVYRDVANLTVLASTTRVKHSLARQQIFVGDIPGYQFELVAFFGRNLRSIWVDGTGFGVAGGAFGLVVERVGGVWREVESGLGADLLGATGFGPEEAYLVGDGGRLLLREEGRWGSVSSGVVTQLLSAHRGPGRDDDVWVVGVNGVVLRGRRHEWRQMPSPDPQAALRAVWVARSEQAYVGSADGMVYRWDGAGWTGWDSGLENGLQGLWGVSEGEIYATGGLGAIARFNGTTWELQPMLPEFTAALRDASALAGEVIVVGSNGAVIVQRNGCWVRINPPPENPDMRSVAVGGSLVFGTSGGGGIYRLH